MTKLKRSLCVVLVLVLMLSLLPLAAFAKAGSRLTGDEKLAYDALVPLIAQVAEGRRGSTSFAIGKALSGCPVDQEVTFTGAASSFDYDAVINALRADHPYELYWYGYSYSVSWRYYDSGVLSQVTFNLEVAQNYRGSDKYTVASAKATAAAAAAANAQAVVDANANKSDYEKLIAYRDYICGAVTYNHYAADNDIHTTNIDPWQLIYVFDGDSSTNVVCEGYSKAFKYLCDLSDFDDESFTCHTVTGWMQSVSNSGGHMWNLVTLAGQNYMVDVTNSDQGSVGENGGLFLTGSSENVSANFTLTYSDGSQKIVTRNGYRFYCGSSSVSFYYDEDTVATWNANALTVAASDFVPGQYCQLNGHNYRGTVITAPTCIETGLTNYVCTVCGESYNGITSATGHFYSSGVCIYCGGAKRVATGVCGGDLIWELDVKGVLTIYGTGAMYDFSETNLPWINFLEAITSVIIPDGVTYIGTFAFSGCAGLTSVTLPATVTAIGDSAFYGCSALKNICFTGSAEEWAAVSGGNDNVSLIGAAVYCDRVSQPAISKLENTASGIKITWNAVAGAAKYRVYAKTSTGWLALGTTTGTSFTYTGAKSGYTYTFTVRCLNSAGTAFTSSFNTSGWKQTYVAQPAISKLENIASGIKITWNAVAGAGKYRVYAKTSTGWLALGTTTGTSFVYTGAKSGYTYTFTVRALNAAGTAFVSSFNTTGWRQKYVAQPAVSGLENTAGGIKITWNAVAGAGKYRVYAKTSTGWVALGTTTGTSFVYTGAKSGYTYTFTVRALNAAGTAFVSSFNATGWRQKYVAQPSVTKLDNTAEGISITWGAVNGAERYRVYVKTASGWQYIGHTTGTSFLWTGAKSGAAYTFTVRCVNAANNAFTSSFNTTGWSVKRT